MARAWRLNRAVANGHISFRSEAEFATASMAELVADDPVAFELAEVLHIACELFDLYWEMSLEMGEHIGTWGDDAPACYIAAVADCCPNYYGDVIRVMCPEGVVRVRFPARDFRAHLTYQETDYSYAGQTSYEGEVMRANSLARINMARCMGTPRADEYLARFKEAFGQPAHAIMLFDLARGIELVYALERAMEILAEPLDHKNSDMPYTPRDGEGHGLGEAPYKLPGREGRPDALSRTGKATARRHAR